MRFLLTILFILLTPFHH